MSDHGDSDAPVHDWNSDDEPPSDSVGDTVALTADLKCLKKLTKTGMGLEQPGWGDEVLVRVQSTRERPPVGEGENAADTAAVNGTDETIHRCHLAPDGELPYAVALGVRLMKRGEVAEIRCIDSYTISGDQVHSSGLHGEVFRTNRNSRRLVTHRNRLASGRQAETVLDEELRNGTAVTRYHVQLVNMASVLVLTEDRCVIKKILRKGSGWASPRFWDTVTFRVEDGSSLLEDGQVWSLPSPADVQATGITKRPITRMEQTDDDEDGDTNDQGNNDAITCPLSEGQVPYKGLARVLSSMKKQEKALVLLHSQQALPATTATDANPPLPSPSDASPSRVVIIELLDWKKRDRIDIPSPIVPGESMGSISRVEVTPAHPAAASQQPVELGCRVRVFVSFRRLSGDGSPSRPSRTKSSRHTKRRADEVAEEDTFTSAFCPLRAVPMDDDTSAESVQAALDRCTADREPLCVEWTVGYHQVPLVVDCAVKTLRSGHRALFSGEAQLLHVAGPLPSQSNIALMGQGEDGRWREIGVVAFDESLIRAADKKGEVEWDLELMQISNREMDQWALEESARIDKARQFKEMGNDLMQHQRWVSAREAYQLALDYCRFLDVYKSLLNSHQDADYGRPIPPPAASTSAPLPSPPQPPPEDTSSSNDAATVYRRGTSTDSTETLSTTVANLSIPYEKSGVSEPSKAKFFSSLHLNLALVALKLGGSRECVTHCDKAIKLDPDNTKALYRKGMACQQLSLFGEAVGVLERAAEMEPQDAAIKSALKSAKADQQRARQQEKRMFGGMFA
ncbi:unnamed protein product [Vitrella brassicaformis CCMP3155]|uniref:Uncharacterized protein n=2 Tax=Vitrella brassicaformis TaxID=1169539 RepID=A0A0G4EVT9_VITBC|nr:unnamed protein product [Vitrella brassicaformis CCMP3155]|eukprot:CEM02542.1 unnamed protein product [Vitrella brassicaformis CCMP3155]